MAYRTRHRAETYELRARILRRLEEIPGGMKSGKIKKQVAKEFGIGWQRLYDVLSLSNHRTHAKWRRNRDEETAERIQEEEQIGYRPSAKKPLA